MAFSCNHQYIKLMIYSFVLYASLSSLLAFSSEEDPTTRARELLPFQQKTVRIINRVRNGETLNLHCSSSETDFGLKHLIYTRAFEFRFKVNWKGTTKFRCHMTWRGGGDHWFTIFKDGRDKCSYCSWEVLGDGGKEKPMVLTRWWKDREIRPDVFYDWDK